MIEQLLAITLGIADIIMVATLGESAVSGVSLVDSIFIFINQLFAALATGGAVVCSQYIGKGSPDMASKTAKQLLGTVFASAVAVAVIGFVSMLALPLLMTQFSTRPPDMKMLPPDLALA